MTIEDSYAEPYRRAIKLWGSEASVLLFPIVGYFALQTRRPADVFLQVANELGEPAQQLAGNIHGNWRKIFSEVRQVCERACMHFTGSLLTPGWDVIRRSTLRDSPVWQSYLQQLDVAMRILGGRDALDQHFALPGDPEYRGVLISAFLPAVTLFRDGRWAGASELLQNFASAASASHDGEPEKSRDVLSSGGIADTAEGVLMDYRSMRQRALLANYRG
jgi:hypothetical protein